MYTTDSTLVREQPRSAGRRRRWPLPLLVLLLLVLVFVAVSPFITLPYYALVPGQAQAVAPLLHLPRGATTHPDGNVLLTDVGVDTDVRLSNWIPDLFDSSTSLVSQGDLTGNLPVSEFNAQGTVDMAESQLTANAVALRQLGYEVPEHDAGVTVYVIAPGSPAWKSLKIGDVITSVDGTPTTNPVALSTAIRRYSPGDRVALRVGSISSPTPGRTVEVKLSSTKLDGKEIPFLGIGVPSSGIPAMGTQPVYDLPFQVPINSDNIGGPSAGLAFTLGILNSLTGGHLTGGRTVAATGTIRPDGTVGEVGGVPQKTVAVSRAHASVFLVPTGELSQARAVAAPGMHVFGVTSLTQALSDLEKMGGELGKAASGPPPGPGGHSVPTDWIYSPWS